MAAKKKKHLKGFTLIELMVSISILVIVSTVGIVSFSRAQIVSRDARRKEDLHNIATALQVYYQANKRYPCTKGNEPGDPISPSISGDPEGFMDLNSYNANGSQPFWLKDTGCGNLKVVNGIYSGAGGLIGVGTGGSISVLNGSSIAPFNENYINYMPVDPLLNNSPTNLSPLHHKPYDDVHDPNSYGYTYWSPDPDYNLEFNNHRAPVGQTYVLWAKLENINDSDSCRSQHYKTCEGIDYCDGGKNDDPKLIVIQACP